MLYSIFGERQPQTFEEIRRCLDDRGWNPATCIVEIYPPNAEEKDRPQFYGWIAEIWGEGGEVISTCAFPDEDLLRDGLKSLGFKEIEIGRPLGGEV